MKYFLNLLFHIAFSPHLYQLISSSKYNEGDLPYIEWCEDAGERRRVTVDKCQSFPFVYPFPNCYCLSGIAVLKIESDGETTYDVQFGKRGCFSHKSYGTFNQRLVELQAFQFNPDETIVGVLGRKENSQELKWTFKRIPQPEPISSSGSIVIYNGQLIDLDEEYKDGVLYCVQRNKDPELSQLVQRYELAVDAMDKIIWVTLKDVCDGGNYLEDENLLSLTQLATPDSQSCTPICPEYEETINSSRSKARTPTIHELLSDKLSDAELLNLTRAEDNNKIKECKPIPFDVKASHWALNRNILKYSIERAFPDQQTIKRKFKPVGSFKILDLLAKITTKYCRNAKIPRDFLEQSIAYFKIAHEGTRTYEFSEYFSTENLFTVQKMLRKCLWALESPLYRHYSPKGCSNPEIFKTYKNESSPQDGVTIKQSVDHQYFDHHLVLDVPWNMLDLANTVCIKGFSGSYRMYHEMEQGIENLFTPQLRQFWLYPEVSSFSSNFYAHLFGSQWMTIARNLEKCVETAYIETPGMSRLQRPTWLSEGGHSQGQHGTHVDQVCTRRRIDIPLVSENYEIYCENSKVDKINRPSETGESSSSQAKPNPGEASIFGDKVDETQIYINWLWPSELESSTSRTTKATSVWTGERAETTKPIEIKSTTDQPQDFEQPEQNEILIHATDKEGAETLPVPEPESKNGFKSELVSTQIVETESEPQVPNSVDSYVSNENDQPAASNLPPSSNTDTGTGISISIEEDETVYLGWMNENTKRSTTMEDYLDWASHSASEYPSDAIPSSGQDIDSTFSLNPNPNRNGDDSDSDSDLELYGRESVDINFDLLLEKEDGKEEDVELDTPEDWPKKKVNPTDKGNSNGQIQDQNQGQHWRRLDVPNGDFIVDNEPNRRSSMETTDNDNNADADVKYESARNKASQSKSSNPIKEMSSGSNSFLPPQNTNTNANTNTNGYKIQPSPKQTTTKLSISLHTVQLTPVNSLSAREKNGTKRESLGNSKPVPVQSKNHTRLTTSELVKMNMYFPIR